MTPRRSSSQLALAAMIAALLVVAARDATRGELAHFGSQCGGLLRGVFSEAVRGVVDSALTDGRPSVRAVAKAIAKAVREQTGTLDDAGGEPSEVTFLAAESRIATPAPPGSITARTTPLRHGLLALPPPLT